MASTEMKFAGHVQGCDPATLAVVDRSVLEAMSGGNSAVEREFITLYRRLNRDDMEKLQQAVADENIADALRASHRITGASLVIGAAALAAVCARIEAASRAGDINVVKANLPALHLHIAQVDHFFESFLLEKR